MHRTLQLACLTATLAAQACCVAADTLVRTPDGERPIGALAIGDRVHSVDVTTGALLVATVVATRRATRECLALRWRSGELVCTPDHPLYAPETGTYRPASDWITGDARTLLLAHEGRALPVELVARDSFAGVHEVVDITLDIEPHNFIAAGVVVHNKSPAPDVLLADAEGPAVTLGPGEEARFRVQVCLGDDDPFTGETLFEVQAITTEQATDEIPPELTVTVTEDSVLAEAVGHMPFDEILQGYGPSCEGSIVSLARSDDGGTASIHVTWTAHAYLDRVEEGADKGDYLTLEIVPEP